MGTAAVLFVEPASYNIFISHLAIANSFSRKLDIIAAE
jgi:hypothetical protein